MAMLPAEAEFAPPGFTPTKYTGPVVAIAVAPRLIVVGVRRIAPAAEALAMIAAFKDTAEAFSMSWIS
jgi:hypothetical protein